jgi:hypothetical protein
MYFYRRIERGLGETLMEDRTKAFDPESHVALRFPLLINAACFFLKYTNAH